MAKILSQFANIFIHYYSNKTASACKLFISEPTQNQERLLGRLFGIIEINIPSRENNNIINLLISNLEDIYYSHAENENLDPILCFEETLKQVNQKFVQMIKDRQIALVGNLNEKTIREKISLSIGLLKDNQLQISYLNNINIFLVHKSKQDYKIIDIKKIANNDESGQGNKENTNLFSNLLSGEVNPPDFLILANGNFLDYISLERIQKIITSLPLHKATEYFKNSLLQFEGQNFAAILIKNIFSDSENTYKEPASLTSITELNYTESLTEKLLAPSLWGMLKNFLNKAKNYLDKIKTTSPKLKSESDINAENIEQVPVVNTEVKSGSDALNNIKVSARKIMKLFPAKNGRLLGKINNFKNKLQLRYNISKNRFRNVPNLSKILLTAGGILILLFIFSIIVFKKHQSQVIFQKDYQEIIAKIEQKRSEAESDLIYGNEDKAKEAINQAQQLLASLPIESKQQKEAYEKLNKNITTIIAKIRHITIIENPSLIADIATAADSSINIQNIIYLNNLLYAFDSSKNESFTVDLTTKEVKKYEANSTDIGLIIKANIIDGKILLYHDKNSFIQYQDQKYIPLSVSLNANAKIADFKDYNDRLYTIDTANNQIYRHSKTDGGYDQGLNWLKEQADFKDIVALGIDTNIWLLDKKGSILKYTKGTKRAFELKNIEPALEETTRLFTNEQTNYLYILEPKNKRIVVIDKNGDFKIQYFSEAFNNLQDFTVNEKDKKIILSSDNKIYTFDLTHL
ncbi:MAG: hypothetical protein NTZ49_04830 [Candidatus Parcubacteria bacterium]|nr:hypothetical protein [Candidatus Parcubacteria bacterium]